MPSRRSVVFAAVALALLTLLVAYLFWLPLRPTAWGGPRRAGPFETEPLPRAGWFARDARLYLERFAHWRSPDRPLEATAEALAGYHALLAVARYGVLWLVLRRLGGSACLAAVGTVAAALPLAFGAPRQDQYDVGLLLFVVLVAVTSRENLSWRVAAFGLPALFAVWANAHTSAVVGLSWLALLTLGRAIEWWRARETVGARPDVRNWLVATVLCAVGTCLNPDGPRLFVDAFAVTKNPSLGTLPAWQPVDFSKPAGMPWGYFVTLALLFLAQLVSPRPYSPGALLVILSFGLWPLVQQRGLLYWWLIVPWLVLPQVRVAFERLVVGTDLRSVQAGTDQRSVPTRLWRNVSFGVIAAILMTTPSVRWLLTGRPRALDDSTTKDTPWRVASELTATEADAGRLLPELRETVRTTYPDGKYRGAILAGLEQGDFLAWVLDGDDTKPLMLYSRPEAIEQRHWAEAHSALDGASDWWETLGRHQVNLVVIDPGRWAKLTERLRGSNAWLIIQDDSPGGLMVAMRREPKLPAELAP
ncbi:MAG TPA: hypothetical protein VKD90_09200 [Gemmataceae bacterium]|nr:hypothetical protein [Gemmataceae bacterium]